MRRVIAMVFVVSGGCALSHTIGIDANVDAQTPPGLLVACGSSTSGLNRDCGWELAGTFPCRAGSSIAVGCDVVCGLGSCTSDSMIRVCPGASACIATQAIGANDDDQTCPGGGVCSFVPQVVCPASGQFTVMTAPFTSGSPYACNVAVR